jgi:hypothetical protein
MMLKTVNICHSWHADVMQSWGLAVNLAAGKLRAPLSGSFGVTTDVAAAAHLHLIALHGHV